MEAFYRLAGLGELAERIRPFTGRPRRSGGSEAPAPGETPEPEETPEPSPEAESPAPATDADRAA